MDHAEVIERLELAAAEPGGLDRLTAGDTPEAAAVAGHLAGCGACADELSRTARVAAVAGAAIRELPDPGLRARTLAFVSEVGVDRSKGAEAAAVTAAPATGGAPATPSPSSSPAAPSPIALATRRPRERAPWRAAVGVAAVLIAAVAGFAVRGAAPIPGGGDTGGLTTAKTAVHIAQQPDARLVSMDAPTGSGTAKGTVMYSPSSGELAVVVSGLAPAPSGASYTCWVEQDGQRQSLGVLYVTGTDGAWAGVVTGLGGIKSGAVFGVSLTSDGPSASPAVVSSGH